MKHSMRASFRVAMCEGNGKTLKIIRWETLWLTENIHELNRFLCVERWNEPISIWTDFRSYIFFHGQPNILFNRLPMNRKPRHFQANKSYTEIIFNWPFWLFFLYVKFSARIKTLRFYCLLLIELYCKWTANIQPNAFFCPQKNLFGVRNDAITRIGMLAPWMCKVLLSHCVHKVKFIDTPKYLMHFVHWKMFNF